MFKNIFYAICIVATALSCDKASNNQKDILQNENSPSSDKTAGNIAVTTDAGLVSVDTSTVSMPVPVTAYNDSMILQAGNPDWDKKIIKTANVTLELKDYKTYNSSIHARLKNFGAYVAQENQTENDETISNEIAIKVPVDKFDELMNSLTTDDVKVINKNISSEDVTGEVVDTKARIEAKKQVREKYLELLKQAKNMNEILQVENEINSIQEDIESASGRVDYLVHSSAYSTINVRYYQFLNGATSKDLEPNFFAQLSDAFKTGSSVISNLVLFVISIWPLIIAGIFVTIYLKRIGARKRLSIKVQNAQVSDTTNAS